MSALLASARIRATFGRIILPKSTNSVELGQELADLGPDMARFGLIRAHLFVELDFGKMLTKSSNVCPIRANVGASRAKFGNQVHDGVDHDIATKL